MPKRNKEELEKYPTHSRITIPSSLFQEVGDIIKLMSENALAELDLETPNLKLALRRRQTSYNKGDISINAERQVDISQVTSANSNISVNKNQTAGDKTVLLKKEAQIEAGIHHILSPIAGTFYRAPSPSAPPFVKVGDKVEVGQPVCIIEAMKLMNEIKADKAGKILQILVENGKPVEKNIALFVIETGESK